MKYFTKEIWLGHNSPGRAKCDWAFEQSEISTREYYRQLEELRPRLSKRNYSFFTNENLHDGRLIAFSAGDGVDYKIGGGKKFNINAHNTSVRLSVLGCNLDLFYILNYQNVRRATFDYPTDEPLFHYEGSYIGDWGYDELTAANDEYFRHEVLFASGTTILIEFKNFSYTRKKCEGSRFIG